MSEKPILYIMTLSPPCRAVMLTGAALGIEFDLKHVDMLGLEHKSPEYLKVNSVYFPFQFTIQIATRFQMKKTEFFFPLFFSSSDESSAYCSLAGR